MLINAQSREELRIAVLSDSTLENYQVEVAEGGLTRGNIYRGVIANLQPSLNAAFIDYGVGRNGFLAVQDVVAEARYKEPPPGKRAQIDDLLIKGKPIVVQVVREPEGQKGAAITTNLSLAGRYLVLTPFDDTRGVSRKVEDDETRSSLKSLVGKLELPEGCGVIVRTNALDQTRAELQRDLAALLRVWKRIQNEAAQGTSARLLYSDQDLILRALRDHLDTAVEEILVDDEAAYQRAHEYLQAFLPRTKTQLIRYTDRIPLFSKYGLESQIERIFNRIVPLPSGGSIVIDRTEALTAIDVNSGRSSSGGGHEEMALATNLEAAREVARQLRLRDLGGLVVVDFIDMRASKNNRAVEKAVKEALKVDKARAAIGRISPNGLLEINRQRIQQALSVRAHRPCPTCSGTGRVPSIESLGLNLLRRIEARAATGRLMKARVELHPELADAIQNGRRAELARIETEYGVEIEIAASPRLLGPEEQIEWRDRPGGATFVPVRPLAGANLPPAGEPAVLDIVPADDLVDGEDESGEAAVSAAAVLSETEAPEAGKRKRRRRGGRRRKRRTGDGAAAGATAGEASDAGPDDEMESGEGFEEVGADGDSPPGQRADDGYATPRVPGKPAAAWPEAREEGEVPEPHRFAAAPSTAAEPAAAETSVPAPPAPLPDEVA